MGQTPAPFLSTKHKNFNTRQEVAFHRISILKQDQEPRHKTLKPKLFYEYPLQLFIKSASINLISHPPPHKELEKNIQSLKNIMGEKKSSLLHTSNEYFENPFTSMCQITLPRYLIIYGKAQSQTQ